MSPLSALASSLLQGFFFRVDPEAHGFTPCYMEAGSAPPIAWVCTAPGGWYVAIAKHIVPKLAVEARWENAADAIALPQDAAFTVTVPDREQLYGLCELIVGAAMGQKAEARPSTGVEAQFQDASRQDVGVRQQLQSQTLEMWLDELAEAQSDKATMVRALRNIRIGQDKYRNALLAYWDNACAVTGLAVEELLRASHCKPWALSSPDERTNPFNGLILAAHLDAAYDRSYITFSDDGSIMISSRLSNGAQRAMGIHPGMRLRRSVNEQLRHYLSWHREHLFK